MHPKKHANLFCLFSLLILFSFNTLSAQTTFTGDNLGVVINNSSTATSVATVNLEGVIGVDATLDQVVINIKHSWLEDLKVFLVAPDGTAISLAENLVNGLNNLSNTTFIDGNPNITTGTAPYSGTYEAQEGAFATAFAGRCITGDWTLVATDQFIGDTGKINDFQITFSTDEGSSCPSIPNPTLGDCTTYTSSDSGLRIPPSGSGGPSCNNGPTTATIEVTQSGTIGTEYQINFVEIDIPHTYVSDIAVSLITPSGTEIDLTSSNGYDSENYTNTVFQDDNPSIVAANPPFTGTFGSEAGRMNIVLAGEEVNGTWTLSVCDEVEGDFGQLDLFKLSICGICSPDVQEPTANCPLDIEVDNDAGFCGAVVSYTIPDPYDECGDAFSEVDIPSGSFFDVGTTVVTVTATDEAENSGTCTFNVIVNDTEDPAFVCPGDIVQPNNPGECGGDWTVNVPTATDNCSVDETLLSADPSGYSNVGATTVFSITVTDLSGNEKVCLVNISVVDTEAPVMACNDIEINLDGSAASITTDQIDGGSTDNCGITNLSLSDDSFDCGTLGDQTVTLTGTDNAGNAASCDATVTVVDNNTPIAVCTNTTVNLSNGDEPTFMAANTLDGGSSAVCAGLNFSASKVAFDCDDIGNTYSVTLTVTSATSGLSTTCTSMVTVEDPNSFCCAAPAAVCNNTTVQLDANGMASVTAATIGAGSTADCGLLSETISTMDFNCDDVGTPMSVTYSITDINEETSSCTAIVTVEDNIAPILTCLDATVDFRGEDMIIVSIDDLFDSNNSMDNCSGITLLTGDQTITCDQLGQVISVTIEGEDDQGNVGNCTANITIDGLPCGWMNTYGIGCDGNNNDNYDTNTETFTLTSDGCSPASPYVSDGESFLKYELCGDGYIKAFVDNVSSDGFAGVELRNSLDGGSKKMAIGTNRVNRLIRIARVLDNYPAWPQEVLSYDKFWVKIERSGNYFRAYASPDDITYVPYLFQTIQMDECTQVGLFVYSKTPGETVTADFTNVEVVEGTPFLETPSNDIEVSASITSAFHVGLSPNPAKEQVNIDLSSLIGQRDVSISIFNISGQLMTQLHSDEIDNSTEVIALDRFPAGTYYVNIKTAQQQQTLKLIKQ